MTGEAFFATLSGRSATAISLAISNNRGGMGFLSSLTATEIRQIADYLKQ